MGPFLDNAFSACQLLAKAELLSSRPTVELVLNSRTHRAVAAHYHAWAKLGNTDSQFAKLLGWLSERRPAARHLKRELQFDESEAKRILALLAEMRDHVEARVSEGRGRAEPDVFYVYATRALRAGELVRSSDFTLTPPR